MNILNIKNEIDLARQKRIAVLFKNLIPQTPSWENFINHLNFQYNNKNINLYENNHSDYKYFNGVMLNKDYDFYLQIRDAQDLKIFPQVDNFITLFNAVYNEKTSGGASFLNFVTGEPSIKMHYDLWDSVFWHCIGTATWKINLKMSDEKPEQIFYLQPGDVIVIPEGVFHSVEIDKPRAGIAMSYNRK